MNRKTYSEEHKTVRISSPKELNKACIICGSEVKFKYPDGGKLVHTLEGDIYQVMNLYVCTNESCELSSKTFNPSPKFDYSDGYFGADVFRLVADEFLLFSQKPEQIHGRLIKKYQLNISIATITRMCDDILMLKALKIDEKTLEIIQEQGYILLGLDGQDPGGDAPSIWCFMDLVSNRILATRKFDSLDHYILYDAIEEVIKIYGVKVIGWVSDKQGLIIKCHDTFYPKIMHQYCQYHFLRNTWNHLVALDSTVYLSLRKVINGLYIHSAKRSTKVYFENIGKISVRKVFESVDKDLQGMIKIHNKTFKELRGMWLYETLEGYVEDVEHNIKDLDPTFRFTKIATRTASTLRTALLEAKENYEHSRPLFRYFQQIRDVFGNDKTTKKVKEAGLSKIYSKIFAEAKLRQPSLRLEECKSFLPSKKRNTIEIMGEWCRLWESYLPGLFQYYNFPEIIKTNMKLEQGFSKEKQALFNRVAKANVAHMVATRGEDYLRIKHCTTEELESDIVKEYSEEIIKQLRAELSQSIKQSTATRRTRSRRYRGFTIASEKYYHQILQKKGEVIFVGNKD
ncbi:MAG: hypothetical protein Lokiarch_07120 [Candidatus Lokiarchaeum sp. GC14_75]|nr:MAG: hypothetical protein Lokiarch_07120 [Candidatus Lokiarchaeum sp. GC14_75]